MARHAASALRWFAFFKTKVEEKSRFSSTFHLLPTYSLHMSRRRTLLFVLFVLFVLWLWGNLSGLPWAFLPIPPIHRSLLSGLRHATCPFRTPARPSPHGLALQLFSALRYPPRRRTRIPLPPQEPTLSYAHLTDRTDHLWLHHAGLARCPQPVRSLKNSPTTPFFRKTPTN